MRIKVGDETLGEWEVVKGICSECRPVHQLPFRTLLFLVRGDWLPKARHISAAILGKLRQRSGGDKGHRLMDPY